MSSLDSHLAEPADELSAEVRHAALRTVCHHATGKDDALELLAMLGLTDEAPAAPGHCSVCGGALPLTARRMTSRYGGICSKCRRVVRDPELQ